MSDVKTPETEGKQPDLASIFVGRARELQQLLQAVSAESAIVLVEGEAGIGKSRLINEFISSVERAGGVGFRSLTAYCPSLPEPFPLGPIIDALRCAGDARITSLHLSDLAGVLRPVFPEWAARLPPEPAPLDDPAAARHRLFRALDELLSALDIDLLVVEDAHWADRATLEFLLFRWSQPNWPGVLTLTYRSQEVAAQSLLRRLVARPPAGIHRRCISLEPLSAGELRKLVTHLLDIEVVSDEFIAFLQRHTGSIPFVIEETLNLLHDRGDIVRSDDAWVRRAVETLAVPSTVGASIKERVERLAQSTRRVLEAAAVLNHPATERTLRTVAGLNTVQTRQGLEKALESRLLSELENNRFELRHALAGRAIYEALPVGMRRFMHRRAVRALEQSQPLPVAELTRHLKYAGKPQRWAHYAEQSADHATATGDDYTATLLLVEILTIVPMSALERGRLGVKLARVGNWAGEKLAGDRLEGVVRLLCDLVALDELPLVQRGELRCRLGLLLLNHVDPRRGVEEIERSVKELEQAPALAVRAMNMLCKSWISVRPMTERRRWLKEVLALLPQVTDKADRAAMAMDAAIQQHELDPAVGWDAVERQLAQAETDIETAERKRLLAANYGNLAYMALLWGRQERVAAWLDTVERLTMETPFRMVQRALLIHRAWLQYYTGRWSSLAKSISQLDVEEFEYSARLEVTLLQGLMKLVAGDVQAGERVLRSVLRDYRGPMRFNVPVVVSTALGRLYLDDSHPDKALALTREAVEILVGAELWPWMAEILPVHVDALIRAGEQAPAEALTGDFESGVQGYDAPATAAALITCRAHVVAARGEHAAAAALHAEAAAAWAALPRRYEELLAVECRATSLLAAGERKPALELLAETEQGLIELGARRDADRVALLLRGHDVEIKRTWRRGRKGYGDELSPREREVIGLMAEGNSNKQIAKRLFISPATVASHAASAMRKVGVGSRTALVSAATESGLLHAGT